MFIYQPWPTQYFEWTGLGLVFFVLFVAAFTDLKNRIIPNTLIFGGIMSLLFYILFFSTHSLPEHLWGFIIGIFVFYSFFVLKIFGGGDSKLMMFVSLYFGASFLFSVCLWVFMIGGLQALFYRYFLHQKSVPYAVSITLGCLFYVLSSFLMTE